MRPLTKYTHQLVNGGNIPARVREAFRLALEERPGAVHLELPEDVAAEEVESTTLFDVADVRRPSRRSIPVGKPLKTSRRGCPFQPWASRWI